MKLDIGYGGAFYTILPASEIGLDLKASTLSSLVDAADRITKATAKAIPLSHPDDADLAFLYGTILTDGRDAFDESSASSNICVFAEREVDRSPTGSGVSARIAVQVAKGQIGIGQKRTFESVTGAIFTARGIRSTRVGEYEAVIVEVGGRSYYTGSSRFRLEDGDAIGTGFLLR